MRHRSLKQFLNLSLNSFVVTNDTQDLRNIHTIEKSCRDALLCTNIALKQTTPVFYLLMEKPLGRYVHVRSPYVLLVDTRR